MTTPTAFFGYPSHSAERIEAVRLAATRLGDSGTVDALPWESLQIGGRLVIDEILSAIDLAELAIFDATDLNQNVLFEIGYAIGAKKRIWILRDTQELTNDRNWRRLGTLDSVGYSPFSNSDHIVMAFYREQPLDAEPLYYQAIRPALYPSERESLLYVKSVHETEASRAITRRLEREEPKCQLVVDDPQESLPRTVRWYGSTIYSASAVVVHMAASDVTGSVVHNARAALVAGLARGMGRPVLIFAPPDFSPAFDYKELIYQFAGSTDCTRRLDEWLPTALATPQVGEEKLGAQHRVDISVELKGLSLGDHVAENDINLAEYFVVTSSYLEVLERRSGLFVGRRGAGKTAMLLRAEDELRRNNRNVVVSLRPRAVEFGELVHLLGEIGTQHERGHLIESLWKFLIYSEIANVMTDELTRFRTRPPSNSVEGAFLSYMEGDGAFLREPFSVRLEHAVRAVLESESRGSGMSESRARISEALHEGVLHDLRVHLTRVLKDKERVAVLVDNLDQAWQAEADLEQLVPFLLGLVPTVEEVESDFLKASRPGRSIPVTLAIFLRSDIYQRLGTLAREPDKIRLNRITWTNDEMLLRVIEERYLFENQKASAGTEVWTRFFVPYFKGLPTKEYILSRLLPRPRDLILFCSDAINSAIDHDRNLIQASDIEHAEKLYSEFAWTSIRAEYEVSPYDIDAVVYEFVGSPSIITRSEIVDFVKRAGIKPEATKEVVSILRGVSFLGVEIDEGEFRFSHDIWDLKLIDALERKFSTRAKRDARYQIHPAFRSALEIAE